MNDNEEPSAASAGSLEQGRGRTMGWLKRRIIEDMEPTEYELARRWIPVEERLPESGETVLVWHYGEVQMAWLNHFTNGVAYFVRDTHYNFEPTHWMPLPAPPADAK